MAKKEEGTDHARIIDHHFRRYIATMSKQGPHIQEFLEASPRSAVRRELIDKGFIIQPQIDGKVGTLVRGLIRTYGAERTMWLVDQLFDSTDPRVKRGDYTFGWLKTIAPHIISSHAGMTQSGDRLSGNVSAARQAMEG